MRFFQLEKLGFSETSADQRIHIVGRCVDVIFRENVFAGKMVGFSFVEKQSHNSDKTFETSKKMKIEKKPKHLKMDFFFGLKY